MGIVSLPSFGSDPATITAAALDGKVDPLATEFNGNIENANIKASAGITYSKLNLASSIVNADISASAAISASKLDLGTIAQDINEAKGADVASATTTTIWVTDGNFVHITGTTTITSFGTAPQAGAERTVVFDGALTLTHNATSLILPTGANITTAAGDVAIVRAETTANARVVAYLRKDGSALTSSALPAGTVIQVVETQSGTYSSAGSTAIPFDNSTPQQSTEGNALASLNTSITPSSASNILLIIAKANIATVTSANTAVALFQDSTEDALAVTANIGQDSSPNQYTIIYKMTAGTTSSTTFKLKAGTNGGNAIHLNGNTSGSLFNSLLISSMTIIEVKA